MLPASSVEGDDTHAEKKRMDLASKRTWEYLQSRTTASDQVWLSQEFVPTLRSLGEWRVYLVGGRIMNVMHTIEVGRVCSGRRVDRFLCLKEIRQVLRFPNNILAADLYGRELWRNRHTMPVTCTELVNPDGGHHHDRARGLQEFQEFVDESFRHLYMAETSTGSFRSSISVFCRFDIGLYFDKDDTPHYFVNEVERTLTASLFLRVIPDREMKTIPHSLAHVLHTYVSDLSNPYLM